MALGWDLTKRDLAQRYRGTVFGLLWPFLYSALLLIVFTYAFSIVLKVRWPEEAGVGHLPGQGALMIFAGLVPYLFVTEAMTRSPTSVAGVPNFVKKVRFPLALLPAVTVGSAAVLSLVNSMFLVLAVGLLWKHIPASALLLPFAYVPLLLLCAGIAWFLGSLGVFFRDLTQISPLVAQFLMFLAPVCYPPDQVPLSFQPIVEANPLTYFVTVFRGLVLEGRGLDWWLWIRQCAIYGAVALAGFAFFRRTRRMFADLL